MTDEYTNPAALEKFHKNERDRQDAGRYNFDEAASLICMATGERREIILEMLVKAAENNSLATYPPNSRVKYEIGGTSDDVFDVYWRDLNEAYWYDLNRLLAGNEPPFDCLFPNPDAPVASPSGDEIPGKMPRTNIGKLAIKAAWQVEHDTSKRATAKQVIKKLQEWVETEPELTDTIPNGVKWVTTKGKQKPFDVEACAKALETWQASRA